MAAPVTRIVYLNALKAGISRLRTKGGPDPETLYDLVNGYVTQAGTVESRPGTVSHAVLPAETKGLCAFKGRLHVFSDSPKAMPPGVVCEVLRHPDDPALVLERIHFAAPMMGALYVVAEWENSDVYHYWLQMAATWQPETVYQATSTVQPTSPNGFTYRPHRTGEPGTLWAPGAERAVGDVIEPTTFNGFEYVVVEAIGSPARSGDVEPTWSTVPGAAVVEQSDVKPGSGDGTQAPPSAGTPPRYGNPGGSRPINGIGDEVANQVIQ